MNNRVERILDDAENLVKKFPRQKGNRSMFELLKEKIWRVNGTDRYKGASSFRLSKIMGVKP
jgi:hypothetical protein